MPEELKDAKPIEESSSTPPPDDKQVETPSTSQDTKEPETLEEAVAAVSSAKREEDEPKAEVKPVEPNEESAQPEKSAAEELPPFHEHPRWKEVNTELKTAREKAKKSDDLDGYLRTSGITEQQFRDMLEIGALMQNDPKQALEKLRPYVDALETYQGLRLSPDLQKKVDEGIIDTDTAQEMSRLRAERVATEKRTQLNEQQQKLVSVQGAIASWEESRRKTDLDFDKKVDLIKDRFGRLLTSEKHDGQPQSVVALVEKAYNEVTATLGGFIPKPPPKKTLTSSGSSSVKRDPETLEEAVAQAASKYRGT